MNPVPFSMKLTLHEEVVLDQSCGLHRLVMMCDIVWSIHVDCMKWKQSWR
jgi:hypothetical protein